MVIPMISTSDADQSTRTRILLTGLRQLRRDGDLFATSATIHRLRNCILTAQGALRLVEARLGRGQTEETQMLLELAETRLREGRALLARSRQPRRGDRRPELRAAA